MIGGDGDSIVQTIEKQKKEQKKILKQIAELMQRLIDFAKGRGSRQVNPADVQQNIDGLSDLGKNLEQYRDNALKNGDVQRAYMAENMVLAIGAVREGAKTTGALNKAGVNALADIAMQNLRDGVASIQNDDEFSDAFSRYDQNSGKQLDATARSFNGDLVEMINRSSFGSDRAGSFLMTLGSRMSTVATKRLQAKPLTAAQKTGLERVPAVSILDEYGHHHGSDLDKQDEHRRDRDNEPELSR